MESLTRLSDRGLFDRRRFMTAGLAGVAGISWLTPLGEALALAAEGEEKRSGKAAAAAKAQSVIVLWLGGGPSQLETFDPHPDTKIAGGTRAIQTAVRGIQLAEGLERTAEEMGSLSLIRSVVSKEGDHERGTITMKTGFRPDPTVVHPSIGAICCHELPVAGTEIPRHVSIVPGQWPARGGFLGDDFDAFLTGDPIHKVPDVLSFATSARDKVRQEHLDVIEQSFARGRQHRVERTLHRGTMANARKMMTSDQLKAFEVADEPAAVRAAYGDTPFGRGCLAARRLIQVGVRCVEVTLEGWDSHVRNHEIHKSQLQILDPALGALLHDLKQRQMLERTIVLCMGEFGRTPTVNPGGGRDHWPGGFSVALGGGGLRGGHVIGETDREGTAAPANPVAVGDIHATVLTALGIDPKKLSSTPIGRTVKYAEGSPIGELLKG